MTTDMQTRQPIPVIHNTTPSSETVEQLLVLFSDALRHSFEVNINERMMPGALYTLQLWASAQQLTLETTSHPIGSQGTTRRTVARVIDKPWFEVAVLEVLP